MGERERALSDNPVLVTDLLLNLPREHVKATPLALSAMRTILEVMVGRVLRPRFLIQKRCRAKLAGDNLKPAQEEAVLVGLPIAMI